MSRREQAGRATAGPLSISYSTEGRGHCSKTVLHPEVSIVIPSYNQAPYLREAIESALTQDGVTVEAIVVDGGSNDGSAKIVSEYEARLARVRVGPDGGQTEAINWGLSVARGELLTFLNSDDVLLPFAAERAWTASKKRTSDDIFFGDILVIDEKGWIRETRYYVPWIGPIARIGRPAFAQPGTFFRRRLLDAVGPFDETLQCCFDTEFWERAVGAGYTAYRVPALQAAFRVHGESKGQASSWHQRYREEQELLRRRYEGRRHLATRAAGVLGRWALQGLMLAYCRRAVAHLRHRLGPSMLIETERRMRSDSSGHVPQKQD